VPAITDGSEVSYGASNSPGFSLLPDRVPFEFPSVCGDLLGHREIKGARGQAVRMNGTATLIDVAVPEVDWDETNGTEECLAFNHGTPTDGTKVPFTMN